MGRPSTRPNYTAPDCCPLKHVFHIAHVLDAYRIFEDRKLRSSLVWDESKLRNTRTCVTWLSPNTWVNGSFYGNIGFRFEWEELIRGKSFYWVEAIEYSPPAYRILITRNRPNIELEPYPVEDGHGPLYHDARNDAWYCNGQYTGEFMLDEDLWLSDCDKVGFVEHHDRTCKKDGATCSDLGQDRFEAGAKLISRLIAQKVLRAKGPLRRLFMKKGALSEHANSAWKCILTSISRVPTTGKLKHTDPAAMPVGSAILDRLGTGRSTRQLSSLFRSKKELELTLRYLAARTLGIHVDKVPGIR